MCLLHFPVTCVYRTPSGYYIVVYVLAYTSFPVYIYIYIDVNMVQVRFKPGRVVTIFSGALSVVIRRAVRFAFNVLFASG